MGWEMEDGDLQVGNELLLTVVSGEATPLVEVCSLQSMGSVRHSSDFIGRRAAAMCGDDDSLHSSSWSHA